MSPRRLHPGPPGNPARQCGSSRPASEISRIWSRLPQKWRRTWSESSRREAEPGRPEPEIEESSPPEPVVEEVVEPESEVEAPTIEPPATQSISDDLGALFAALRGGDTGERPPPPAPVEQSPEIVPATDAPPAPAAHFVVPATELSGWLDERDVRLLPITNRALRGVKKAVTDAQNIALDNLRTEDEWRPDGGLLADTLRADLIGLWAESYSAGHTVAEEMTGLRLKRPETPHSDAADGFGEALSSAIDHTLAAAGDGQRERQSAASRVFRGWRTDEAERRIRELAFRGYHLGVLESVGAKGEIEWVAGGVPCSACRDAASDPAANVPPVHSGCGCTLVAVS